MIDDRVYAIMRRMEAINPDDDPGDLAIDWQDDAKLVTVQIQDYCIVGQTADEALDTLLIALAKDGKV